MRPRAGLAGLLAALVLAGCGPAAATPAGPPDPASLLAQARTATLGASSYRATGMFSDSLSGEAVITPDAAEGTLSEGGETWQFRAVGGVIYYQSAALWQHTQPAAVAAKLGASWVRMDGTPDYWGTVRVAGTLDHAVTTLILGAHAGLVDKGIRSEGGRQVIDLESTTDLYWVGAASPHYPYRWVDLAESAKSGDTCGLDFGDFNAPVSITAPPGALSFAASGAGPGPGLSQPSATPQTP